MELLKQELQRVKRINLWLIIANIIFIFLPLLMTYFVIQFLPDQVPLHYGAHNLVDDYGNKSELWMIAFRLVGTGAIYFFACLVIVKLKNYFTRRKTQNLAQSNSNEEEVETAEKQALESIIKTEKIGMFLYISSILMLSIHICIQGFSLYTSYYQIKDLDTVFSHLTYQQLTSIGCGIFYIVLGLCMRKIPRNKYVGLVKTQWSQKNDTTWYKCQEFGGKLFVVIGLIISLSSIFVSDETSGAILVGLTLIGLLTTFIHSYIIAQKY